MDQCTHEVRAEYWKSIIRACGQRPAGQSAKSWMKENGVSEQSYYHWQRKFRQQSYDLMMKDTGTAVPAVQEKADVAFVEIPCIPSLEGDAAMTMDNSPVAVIRTSTMSIEITNDISDRILTAVLREVGHA